MTNKTVLNEPLPTENMIVAGMEAIGMLQMNEEYQQLTGCQQIAEAASVCWAAMVSQMQGVEPRQDKAPSDNEILAAWRESHWATYDSDPQGVVKFARLLFKRYEQTVLQSPEIQQLRKDAERYRWLKERMIAVDFDYGEPPCTALVFHMPSSAMSFSCSCDANIDAAMEVKPCQS